MSLYLNNIFLAVEVPSFLTDLSPPQMASGMWGEAVLLGLTHCLTRSDASIAYLLSRSNPEHNRS